MRRQAVPGTFAYTPSRGTVLAAGIADAVGDLHPNRRHRLQHRPATVSFDGYNNATPITALFCHLNLRIGIASIALATSQWCKP